ncbi:ATP-binding protein [bacterium]|nr:ATP-binding protein [bacterium]
MKNEKQHLLPREISFDSFKDFFFPNVQTIDPKLKSTFYKQATASLSLIIIAVTALSLLMLALSLFSNISTFELIKTLLIIFAFFAAIIIVRRLFSIERLDYSLLVLTIFFILSWGVAKDVSNFGVEYNAYGWMFVSVVFFGLVFMPFMPKFSLILAVYCSVLYMVLWVLFVIPLVEPTIFLGSNAGNWFSGLLQNIQSGKSSMEQHHFYTATHFIVYFLFGGLAFIFRAANLRSYIKTVMIDKKLSNQEIELKAARALLLKPESQHLEFKSSARWDYRENKTNKELEKVIIKTIAGFMNSDGGILFIGVDDNGNAVGLEKDFNSLGKKDSDGFHAFIIRIISAHIGREYCENVRIFFHLIDNKEVCSVSVEPSQVPVFLEKHEGAFFVRTGNSTQRLNAKEALEYIGRHFQKT